MLYASNMTLEEILRLHPDVQVKDVEHLIGLHSEQALENQKELARLRRDVELSHEQLEFARQLLDSYEAQLNNGSIKSAKQAKEAFKSVIENGYFER